MSKKITCCICGARIKDRDSSNPRPVKYEGRCCDACDVKVVRPARLARVKKGLRPYDGNYKWSRQRELSYIKRMIT